MRASSSDPLQSAVTDYDAAVARHETGDPDSPELARARLALILALLESGWAPEARVMAQALRDVRSIGPDLLAGVDLDVLLPALRQADDLLQRDAASATELQSYLDARRDGFPEQTTALHLSRARDWRLASAVPLTWSEFLGAARRLAPGLGLEPPRVTSSPWVMQDGLARCVYEHGQVSVVGRLSSTGERLMTGIAESLFAFLLGHDDLPQPAPGAAPGGWAAGLRRGLGAAAPAAEPSAVVLRYRTQVLVGARHRHDGGAWALDQDFEQLAWAERELHLHKAIALALQRSRTGQSRPRSWKDVHGEYSRAAGAYSWEEFQSEVTGVVVRPTVDGTVLSLLGRPDAELLLPAGRGHGRAVAREVTTMLTDGLPDRDRE